MVRRCSLAVFMCLVALGVCLSTGCATGFIREQARTSLASFVTGVFSTAVNEVINPD